MMGAPAMTKRIVGIALTLLVVGFIANNFLESRSREQAAKAKQERFERETISAVAAMVARTNAVRDWGKRLSADGAARLSPILTIELERAWIQPQPILFVGDLQDIRGLSPTQYEMEIRHGISSPLSYPIGSNLALALKCDKALVDAFLSAKQSLPGSEYLNEGVAVVAYIDQVRAGNKKAEEDEKIGIGRCEALLAIGSILLPE